MKREELKEYLKNIGVNEKLIEMPAVVEPIFEEFENKTIKELENSGRITALQNGDLNYIIGYSPCSKENGIENVPKTKQIKFDESTGGAIAKIGSTVTIYINKYGIEEKYVESWGYVDLNREITRESGKIIAEYRDELGKSVSENFDNGNCLLENAQIYMNSTSESFLGIGNGDSEYEEKFVDCGEVIRKFDETALFMSEQYPQTTEWYSLKRAELEKEIEEYEKPENKIKILEAENSKLRKQNRKYTLMMKRMMDFIDKVKCNPFAKVILRKHIRKYDNAENELPEGEER